MEFSQNDLILISGLVLLGLVGILNYVKYRHEKKVKKIIKSHRGELKKPQEIKENDSKTKGWGMNNSPFRERKSGLTWGGGNIHAANATRGTRKSFLNKR